MPGLIRRVGRSVTPFTSPVTLGLAAILTAAVNLLRPRSSASRRSWGAVSLAGALAVATMSVWAIPAQAAPTSQVESTAGVQSVPEMTSSASTTSIDLPPSFISGNSASGTVGRSFLYFVATLGLPVARLSEQGALPSGITFSPEPLGLALLSGTPAPGSAGTYTFTITARNRFGSATQTFTLTISGVSQTISFTSTPPTNATVGSTYTPTATASSGLPVTFTVDPSSTSACSIAGGVVTFDAAGTCTIDANQPGNGTYGPAPQVQQSVALPLTVPQTITFTSTAPTSATVGSTYTPTARADSGLPVTITVDSSSSSVCSIAGGVVTFNAVGTCVLDANQAGNAGFNAAPQVQQSVAVTGVVEMPQTITFTSTAPISATVGSTYTPTATASSGLPVTITVDSASSSVCSIAGGVVTFNSSLGGCVIDANQPGNASFAPAPQVQQIAGGALLVPQTITFTSAAPTNATVGSTYTPTATADSGLPVTITVDSSSSSVCSIAGGVVTFNATGTCVLDANQPGNTMFSAAPQVQQSVSVALAAQTITFTSTVPSDPTVGSTYTPTATASSGLPVTITVDSGSAGTCSIAGGVVTFNSSLGICIIDANQPGNAMFSAAPQVQQSVALPLTVPQTITFTSTAPTSATVGSTYTPTARADSGLPVTITVDSSSSSVCSIAGGVVTFNAVGTCVLDANQAGNAGFNAAPQVQQSVTI